MQEKMNDYSNVQTVGEILRNARTKQGKKLHTVADDLCIRVTYLEAIENMDLKNIPQPPYGIGFIRSYAEYLGLNSERIVSSYKQTLHGITEKDENVTEKTNNSSKPKLYHVLLGILGLGIIAYAWLNWPLYQDNSTMEAFESNVNYTDVPQPLIIEETEMTESENASNENVSDDETDVIVAEDNTAAAETEKDNIAMQDAAKSEVKMLVIGPTWVEIKVNGETILSKTLQKNYEYIIDDAENTTVTVGRYYNVKFYVGNSEIKPITALKHTNVALKEFLNINNQE